MISVSWYLSEPPAVRFRRLRLSATARLASFAEQGEARDHLFVQHAHLAPRFFVACPDLFADCSEFCPHVD